MPGTMIPRGNIREIYMIAPSLTPSQVGANTSSAQSFTVRGLLTNDMVDIVSNSAQTAGIGIANTRITANDTLEITFMNSTGSGATPVAGIYTIRIHRPENATLPVNAV